MKKLKKIFLLIASLLIVCGKNLTAQVEQKWPLGLMYYHVFDADSLNGFDEVAARVRAINEQSFGDEFKVAMYLYKREFINNKYHLPSPKQEEVLDPSHLWAGRVAVQPGCTNEDFEASSAGAVNNSSQIAGWSIFSGSITSGASNCLIAPATDPAVGYSELIDCTGGYVDANVGPSYPIYSIFGSGSANAAAAAANPQISAGFFGNKILRLNNYTSDAAYGGANRSKETLVKTFAVTPSNSLFRFAFISVLATGHGCCDGSGILIRISAAGNPLSCPAFSIYSPSSSCLSGDAQNIQYYVSNSSVPYNPSTSSAQFIYNRWNISALDLSSYLNQNLTLELTAYDCNQTGHYGYMYIDAQCSPLTVIGNGIEFEASITQTPNIATCGLAGATVCAVDGMGPYSWAGPALPAGYSVPSMTNQCMTTNLSATYTLYMQPPGSCAPIPRVIQTVNSPAPLLLASNVQASCGNTLSVASLTLGGSLTPGANYTLNWSPLPTLNTASTIGTYTVPPPLSSPLIVTVTALDVSGCHAVSNMSINPTVPLPTFTLFNASGTSSITCANPQVNLLLNSNYNYGPLDISWVGPGAAFTGTTASYSAPGMVTVTVHDVSYTCATVQHYTIGINQIVPTGAITTGLPGSPSQAITCANPDIHTMTMTATNPTINISHIVSSPAIGGSLTISTASTVIYYPVPGSYDYYLVNNVTGCTTHSTFAVTTSSDFPTFSISSTPTLAGQGNYTVGCNDHSLTVINIVNPNTSPTPGGSLDFGFIQPGQGPGYTPTSAQSTVVSMPGTWTVIVNSVNNTCVARIPVTIIQNTIAPNISAIVPTQILDCATPSTTLLAQTTNSAAAFSWVLPGSSVLQSSTLAINTTTNASSTSIGNYTLSIKDQDNGCISNSVVPMQQNIFVPTGSISVTSKTITCITNTLQLSNSSTTGIPPATGFPTLGIIQAMLWEGPVPQPTLALNSSYIAATPGTYTLTIRDSNNGCTSTKTITIEDGRVFPVMSQNTPTFILDCGTTQTNIYPAISSTLAYNYDWSGPAFVGGTNTKTVIVSAVGLYNVGVTNPSNGCGIEGLIEVKNGQLLGGFYSDKTGGYAPLNVAFTNTSASSSGSSSITSVWNYGNGTYTVTNSNSPNGQAVYTQPGTYKVTLYTVKGSCKDSNYVYITVDIPSKLEAPNVFTPNGDGVNDLFFLKVANLTEMQMTIYDRWGNLVYDLSSETGNIAWDGKNTYGKDAAAGVYFYVLKAKGKDDKDYNTKGTINLYR